MLQFQSHIVAAASNGFEALASLNNEDHPGSVDMISTPYQSPWMNLTSSSSSSSFESVLFDDRPLDLSGIDTFVNQMVFFDSWGSLEKSHEIARPLKTEDMQTSDSASDLHLNALSELVKKCNAPEDLFHGEVNPWGSFLQDVTVPLNNTPGYNMGLAIQQDSLASEPKESSENDSMVGILKLNAKRSIGARTGQFRPNKREALHHKSGEMEISQREIHVQSERERRKGMNNLFERMRTLLPSPTQKADKSTLVSEIINYIQSLQQNLEDLNKIRAKKVSSPGAGSAHIKTEPVNCAESIQSRCTDSDSPPSLSMNEESTKQAQQVTLHFNGNDIFITICCSQKANLLPAIIYVVEDHNLQIMCANVSKTDAVAFHCLHVKALDSPDINIKQVLRDALKNLVCLDNQIRMEQ